jgi:hypothetical protein
MENRERDRVSQRTSPTEAGDINRQASEERGREQNSGTSAEFGQKIGRSEDLSEGGEMHNKDDKNVNRSTGMGSGTGSGMGNDMGNESTRRPGSEGYGSSSSDRQGSSGEQNISGSQQRKGSSGSGSLGNTGSSDRGGSSEGRH